MTDRRPSLVDALVQTVIGLTTTIAALCLFWFLLV